MPGLKKLAVELFFPTNQQLFFMEYMFLLGGNIMPGTEKLWGELLFPEEKMVVFSTEGRKNNFFRGKQMFFSEFFWPRHNVFSLKDTFSSYFILWPTINLYFLVGSVSYCHYRFCIISWPKGRGPPQGWGGPGGGKAPLGWTMTTFLKK